MKIDFHDQTVLVTGATRGIGKQVADDFGSLGARLILTGTDKQQVKSLNEEAFHTNALKKYFVADFLDKQSTENFLNEIGNYDRIDVCVNNAGINRINYIDESLVEDFEDILAVNLHAPFMIIRAISRIMKRNGYGRIVNISSIFGVISKEKRSVYSVSKFGLHGLTVSSANELACHNVLVNTVSPGFVNTVLTERILGPEEMAVLASQVPIGRFAEPAEISRVVLFLASRLNTYIAGQNIIADGGFVNV